MYAPAFHPAMRFVGPTRREIGIRNVFNILGPLTNPAGAQHQLIGVGHPDIAGKLAEALRKLGSEHAVLVHAEEGLDELGISGPTTVTEYDRRQDDIRTYTVTPEELGLSRGRPGDLAGGDTAANVKITLSILQGEQGPRRDVVLLNAGAGIYAANGANSIFEGIERAREALDSGAAYQKMQELVAVTNELVPAEATGVSA
jgi:anthranilate phosphoribosyltransferase